jgi:hypothetical protein
MENIEALFKLFLEFIFFMISYLLLSLVLTPFTSFFISIMLAHTMNWLFNGHLFVLGRYLGFTYSEPQKFIEYPGTIKAKLIDRKSITAVAFFGSLTSSDLDIRIIHRQGLINGFIACFWGFTERARALRHRYPIDLYVIGKSKSFEKLRKDEVPIVLFDHNNFIKHYYSKVVDYEEFKRGFLRKYVA